MFVYALSIISAFVSAVAFAVDGQWWTVAWIVISVLWTVNSAVREFR